MADAIVYSGVTVDLGAVEHAVGDDPSVAAVIAVGVNDIFLGNALHVFVVVADGVTESYDLRKRLLDAACTTGCPRPRALRFVDALPTAGGRPSRPAVAAIAGGQPADAWKDQVDDEGALDALVNAR